MFGSNLIDTVTQRWTPYSLVLAPNQEVNLNPGCDLTGEKIRKAFQVNNPTGARKNIKKHGICMFANLQRASIKKRLMWRKTL